MYAVNQIENAVYHLRRAAGSLDRACDNPTVAPEINAVSNQDCIETIANELEALAQRIKRDIAAADIARRLAADTAPVALAAE